MGFYKIDERFRDLVDTVANEMGLHNYIDFKVLAVSKSKTMVKVKKTSAETDAVANVTDCVTVTIYERAFERLDTATQKLLIEDALNTIAYDTEKCKIVSGSPQIVVTQGGRMKYGDTLINAAETALLAIQQIIDEEDEAKKLKKLAKAK